ncbi:MAG: TonB-dependent receptor [Chitinophagaceae bacterium]
MRISLLIIYLLFHQSLMAQSLKQVVRGSITDKILSRPIEGAIIQIVGSEFGTRSDASGHFVLPDIPVGTHHLSVSALGYKTYTLPHLVLNSGKELVLQIQLEENFQQVKEVRIKGGRKKNTPLNELSLVSARVFSVEETQKYAAAVNDPARMATSYPGVMAGDDGNNQIVIRGNSPSGLLWRMEGMDIPNPNHFAVAGSSGGGISILSAQLMANADFVTGAFAAEYGNALSGVFDLRLRKGNNHRREYTAQLGLLGLNLAAEGPFSKKSEASYLINYRYSTLSMLNQLGLNLTPSVTNFQDLSYHIVLPTRKWGTWSAFGFGGLSDQFFNAQKDSTQWKNIGERYSDRFVSNTGMWGFKNSLHIRKNALLHSMAAYSLVHSGYERNYTQNDYSPLRVYNQAYQLKKLSLSSTLNQRLSARSQLRSGLMFHHYQFVFREHVRDQLSTPLDTLVDTKNTTQTLQAFSQFQTHLSEQINVTMGVHALYLLLNKTYSLEPRAAISWNLHPKSSISFGYGLHSQLQSWGVYFAQNQAFPNAYPNRNLGFSKAHHWVLSHQYAFHKNLRLKTEFYYQALFNVPVSQEDSSTFSAINVQYDMVRMPLNNSGKGRNYGIEISLEKYLDKHFYYLASLSLYESKYRAANHLWYNSKFNGNHLINAVAGKEFVSENQRRTFSINVKMVYAGGYRTTPIDLQKSIDQDQTIYREEEAFKEKLPAYFRGDLRLSMKWNRKRLTSTLSLDIQNVSNRLNVFDRFYDPNTRTVKTYYQTGLIPILNYKVEW